MRALRSSHPHVRSLSSRLAPRSFAFFRASAKHIERGWRPEGGVKALKFKLRLPAAVGALHHQHPAEWAPGDHPCGLTGSVDSAGVMAPPLASSPRRSRLSRQSFDQTRVKRRFQLLEGLFRTDPEAFWTPAGA
jgi:hypothetical protein